MRAEFIASAHWDCANVRSRAPLRLGLGGGGTDLMPYCDDWGGVVLNATIDRYAYAHLLKRDDRQVVFKADDLGKEETLPCTVDLDIHTGLSLHRAVYRHMMMHFNADQSGLAVGDTEGCVKGKFTMGGNTYTFFGCDSLVFRPNGN